MTIASAIAALNPSIWYRLDEASGTNAVNYGTQVNNGTYSGSYVQAVPGPEIGTLATRFGVGGAVRSGVMDLTGAPGQTLGCWMQTNATGAINTSFPILSLGIPGNVATRGPRVLENHATVNVPRFAANWANSAGTSAIPPTTTSWWWRWIVCTFASGTNGIKLYVDGALLTQGNNDAPVSLVATDVFQVWGSEPWTIAHACWWGSVLTLAEIQTVAAQLSDYPGGQQIYLPPTGGGGGGLTTDQATQLSDIDTKTDDIPGLVSASTYISDTVNVINGFVQDTNDRVQDLQAQMADAQGKLDTLLASVGASLEAQVADISSFVQRVFQTGTGAFLSSPIGSLLSHPDPNLLQASSSSFVISGRGTCPSPGALSFGNVFGIQWAATTTPIRAGYRQGVIDEYNQRLVQFVRYFIEPHTGILYAGDIADFAYQNYTWFWDRPFPHQIDYDVLPGFELTCRYIYLVP